MFMFILKMLAFMWLVRTAIIDPSIVVRSLGLISLGFSISTWLADRRKPPTRRRVTPIAVPLKNDEGEGASW